MRVLLLGATGNTGVRCITALLAHKHVLILYIRNPTKLRALVTQPVLDAVEAIVIGDATDPIGIKKAMLDHDVEGIIDVAGNQVYPWKEYLLPKIARAVTEAAVAVGKERARPLRAWITSGVSILEYPGTGYLIQDYAPKLAVAQHQATRDVVEAVSVEDLRWSLICVGIMHPADPKHVDAWNIKPKRIKFDLLEAPQPHNLVVKATEMVAWDHSWLERIPLIGRFFHIWFYELWTYTVSYEDVADFLASDLENDSEEWIGKKVGYKDKGRLKRN